MISIYKILIKRISLVIYRVDIEQDIQMYPGFQSGRVCHFVWVGFLFFQGKNRVEREGIHAVVNAIAVDVLGKTLMLGTHTSCIIVLENLTQKL